MGETLRTKINIPLWSLLLSILLVCGSFIVNSKVTAATQDVRIEKIEEQQKDNLTAKDLHYIVIQLDEIKDQNCRIEKKTG
jgi:hypothetical protein